MNTGNKGPIEHQPGDWVCGKCDYLNWRRRRVCQTCFPYAEGNGDSVSAAQHAERMAYVVAMCAAMGLGSSTPPPMAPQPQQQQQQNAPGRIHGAFAIPPPMSSASSLASVSASSGSGEANIVYQTPPSPASYAPPSSSASFRFQPEQAPARGANGANRPPLSLSSALAAAVQNQGASMPSPSPLLPSFLKNDVASPMSAFPHAHNHNGQAHPFSLTHAFDGMNIAPNAAAKQNSNNGSNSTSPALSPSSTASFALDEGATASEPFPASTTHAHPNPHVRPRQRSGDLGFGAIGSGKGGFKAARSASLPLASSHPAFKSNVNLNGSFYALPPYAGEGSHEGSESAGSGSTSSLTLVSGPVSVPGAAGVNGAAAAASAANIWSLGCEEKGW